MLHLIIIETGWLIGEASYLPSHYIQTEKSNRVISRAVLMTNKSIQTSESEELTLIHLPCPDDPNRPVAVLELSPSSMSSPQGLYLVHLTREGSGDCKPQDDLRYAVDTLLTEEGSGDCKPQDDLQYAVDTLLTTDQTDSRPSVLWYMYFNQTNSTGVGLTKDCPEGITVTQGPGTDLDLDHIVTQAKEIFERILPDEEFLPKAPNPEDIIYDDGQNTQTGDGFKQTDGESPSEKTMEGNSAHESLIKQGDQGDFHNASTGSVEGDPTNGTPLNCSASETEEQI